MSNLINTLVETVAKYQRATTKPYQKISHIMMEKDEMLVPSDNEEYIFRLDEGWKVTFHNSSTIIIRKEINKNRQEIGDN